MFNEASEQGSGGIGIMGQGKVVLNRDIIIINCNYKLIVNIYMGIVINFIYLFIVC